MADEAETFSVSVMRLGSLDGEVRCHYRTQDTWERIFLAPGWGCGAREMAKNQEERDGFFEFPFFLDWQFYW